jgi:hypothetical protein
MGGQFPVAPLFWRRFEETQPPTLRNRRFQKGARVESEKLHPAMVVSHPYEKKKEQGWGRSSGVQRS